MASVSTLRWGRASFLCSLVLSVTLLYSGCTKRSDGSEPDAGCMCKDGSKASDCSTDDGCGGKSGSGDTSVAGSGHAGSSGGDGSTPDVEPGNAIAEVAKLDFESGEKAGDWEVANDKPFTGGKFAARPPMLDDLSEASFDYDCDGKAHTELSFRYVAGSFGSVVSGEEMQLFVDGALYENFSTRQSNGYTEYLIVVPAGTHSYRWTASVETTARPEFWVDEIVCSAADEVPNTNRSFDLDNGFVPEELTGDWLINNSNVQGGVLGLRPPLLDDLGSATADLACPEHTEMSFYYVAGSYGSVPAGQELNFYIDGDLYEKFSGRQSNGFSQSVVVVPRGPHTYRWEAKTDTAGRPMFWIDSIKCVDEKPSASSTGRFDLDDHFVPEEFSGDWLINNSKAQDGSGAAQPPFLDDSGSAAFEIQCEQPHGHISFFYVAGSNGSIPAGQEARFLVDGTVRETLSQSNGFREFTMTVDEGPHTYRWEASVQDAGRPMFWVDTITCN